MIWEEAMSLHFLKSSKIENDQRILDLRRDKILNYEDNTHLRIFKLFESTGKAYDNIPSNTETTSKNKYKTIPNLLFHLRFYFQRETLLEKEKRVKRLIIMTNGLNEVSHFNLYDQLGLSFAEKDCCSVLLPGPFHFNRRPRALDSDKIENKYTPQKMPSDFMFNDPLQLYYHTKQYVSDIKLDDIPFLVET